LAGVTDPEQKRKIIGGLFIQEFETVARELVPAVTDLALGPGHALSRRHRIGFGSRANIKSHHNVGGLPEDLSFELVEPLRLLF